MQAPELRWNLPITTRVTVVVDVDDHRHYEAPTQDGARSLSALHPLPECVAFLGAFRGRRHDRNKQSNGVANAGQNILLPIIPRAYPTLIQPCIPANTGDRVVQPPGGVDVLTHVADEDRRRVHSRTNGPAWPSERSRGVRRIA